jgi:hypothetical protein
MSVLLQRNLACEMKKRREVNSRSGRVERSSGGDLEDSICLKCYLTVTTGAKKDDLQKSEQSHDCAELLAIKATGM